MNLTQGGRGGWKQEKAEMDDYSWRQSQRHASFVLLISDIGFSELDNLFERNERNSSKKSFEKSFEIYCRCLSRNDVNLKEYNLLTCKHRILVAFQ